MLVAHARVYGMGTMPQLTVREIERGGPDAGDAVVKRLPVGFHVDGRVERLDTPFYDGALLKAGNVISGPANRRAPRRHHGDQPGAGSERGRLRQPHHRLQSVREMEFQEESAAPTIEAITLSVIGGALVAIGKEMGQTLKRLAFSPGAQQIEDIGGGLFTVEGSEICESDTTPMHIGSIPAYIEGFMRRLAGRVYEGDVIIHNHPYHGASHSPDLLVAIPVFWEGEQAAWSAATTHLTDVGGLFPGIAIDVPDVFAEAKLYDSLKLYDRGVRNEALWQSSSTTRACRPTSRATPRR